MKNFKDFLLIEDKNKVTKKINSYINKIDSLPNSKLSSELKQIRKNFVEVLKNMNLFNDSDFSEFLKANNTKLMLQASNNLLKILNKNISEKEKKEWRKMTKELKNSLDDSKEIQEWEDGLNDHLQTRPRETYHEYLEKFQYEVNEHDGGVLGYRRI